MEILSYVLSGTLAHEDSLGHVGLLKPGDVQRMSAGTGVQHSEYNGSDKENVHFYQIWILPDRRGLPPRYEDRHFPLERRKNQLCLIASPDGADGSLSIHQDARAYAAVLDIGAEVSLEVAEGRGIWVQAAKGKISVGHGFSQGRGGMECAGEWTELEAGDGMAITDEKKVALRAEKVSEVLLFDLA